MEEDRKDKIERHGEEIRGKVGKDTPLMPGPANPSRSQSSGTVIESVRDYPSDGPCDPFRRKSRDD
ncbi:MAG: hypothetical protein ACYC64_16420 [Armatimonadota bacterium]